MAVIIRLRRIGSKKRPFYRLVVTEEKYQRDGRFIEILGYYNPKVEPPDVNLKEDKIVSWIKKGAKVSDQVRSLLRSAGVLKRLHAEKYGITEEVMKVPQYDLTEFDLTEPSKTGEGKKATVKELLEKTTKIGKKAAAKKESDVETEVAVETKKISEKGQAESRPVKSEKKTAKTTGKTKKAEVKEPEPEKENSKETASEESVSETE